jgi:hypothetical protein
LSVGCVVSWQKRARQSLKLAHFFLPTLSLVIFLTQYDDKYGKYDDKYGKYEDKYGKVNRAAETDCEKSGQPVTGPKTHLPWGLPVSYASLIC